MSHTTTLATQLWTAGLAPKGTTRLDHADGPTFYTKSGARWEPWRSWDAVAHLIERYDIMLRKSYLHEGWHVEGDDDAAYATAFHRIPATVCMLALRLWADEQEAAHGD